MIMYCQRPFLKNWKTAKPYSRPSKTIRFLSSCGFVESVRKELSSQQSPRTPYFTSPGLMPSLMSIASSGAISWGRFHSTSGVSAAYSGNAVISL
jgi:hypothetical protein